MSVRSDLIRAVSNRRVVELGYEADDADRLVHPHILYRTSAGNECVDTYQVAGPTHSGTLPEWRLFDLRKIRRLNVLDEGFSPAPGYDPASRKYRHGVIARA
jgi:hypothetical protein